LRRVEAVINSASGHVGPGAAEELEEIVSGFGLAVRVADAQPKQIPRALQAAVAARPDLLIVLAGDGTARLAADLVGPDGPLLAPLPGGTMNVLPRALYGTVNWQAALRSTLEQGQPRSVSGGAVGGHSFYVAAIVGSPALWADAREAIRFGRFGLAVTKARRALAHAFSRGVRFTLDGGERRQAEALALICPLVSRALSEETALEAIALDPHDAGEAIRLGLRTLFADLVGDWRADPAVSATLCARGEVWSHGRLPLLLDGESQWIGRRATIEFRRNAFRALAPVDAVPVREVTASP
jgi:diacylglycerol kinase family enzyme